jgi:Protein of unknown function (DUF4031)
VSVYVDDIQIPATVQNGPHVSHTSTWSHLIADSRDELHLFAVNRLGLQRRYFQEGRHRGDGEASILWHYDLTAPKRLEAIRKGALAVSWRDIPAIIAAREAGQQWEPPAVDPAQEGRLF